MVEKARGGGRPDYWWEWSQGAKDSAPRGFNIQDYHFPHLALKLLCRGRRGPKNCKLNVDMQNKIQVIVLMGVDQLLIMKLLSNDNPHNVGPTHIMTISEAQRE